MDLWFYDSMVLWIYDSMVLWIYGSMIHYTIIIFYITWTLLLLLASVE